MKKGILFLNGTPPEECEFDRIRLELSESDALVVCTDGAYRYVGKYLLPDVVVGDFDSCDESEISRKCEIVGFPADKDYTDGYLAVKILADRGCKSIDIYGAYGGRVDMAESNFSLLALARAKGMKARFVGEFDAYLADGDFSAKVRKGATFSLVPFSDKVHILYTKGLKYALADYQMCKYDNIDSSDYIMGVSNVCESDCVEIAVRKGLVLVFIQH